MKISQSLSGRTLGVASLALLLASVAFGQQPTAAHPAQEAPELYLSFFFFHENFAKWTEDRIAAYPAQRARILASSSKFIGISTDEFDALEAITKQVTSNLRALGDEAHQNVSVTAGTKAGVDRKKLADFNVRRLAIIQDGINAMTQTLSPQSWQGLHGYINNQHRQHVTAVAHGASGH
jgi:hypothetical protein